MESTLEHFGLAGAAKQFRIDGRAVNPSTIFRWMREGVLVRGRRVRLGSIRLGRRLTTTAELIAEFRRELIEAEKLDSPPQSTQCQAVTPQRRSPAQRQRAIEAAEKRLAAAGV